MLEKFFQTEAGQKLLLLLAPFFLSPQECATNKTPDSLFKYLSMSVFAPALGSVFFISSCVTLYRILENKGYPISWLLDLSSAKIIFWGAGLLILTTYLLALARRAAGYILTFFQQTDTIMPNWPLSFWLSYYGGNLIVVGALIGIFSGFMSWNFSLSTGLVGFALLVLFCIYIRFEIKFIQEKRKRQIRYHDWHLFNLVTVTLFALSLGAIIYLAYLYRLL